MEEGRGVAVQLSDDFIAEFGESSDK